MRKLTCDPEAEIRGSAAISLVDNLRAEEITPFLQQFGFEDVHADAWYSANTFLELLNELGQKENLSPNYVAIGMRAAETAYMPPELENSSLSEILLGWNEHYHANHRGADIGNKITSKVDDQHYQISMDSIYPDDLEYGMLYGFARRFLPQGTHFTVWYDKDVRRMDEGGDRTIIHISWG